jgi:hypothetical protein
MCHMFADIQRKKSENLKTCKVKTNDGTSLSSALDVKITRISPLVLPIITA